ncbi:MAG TPA: LUD domain-containing protein [Rectinemataceae bacterium]|nr:LUD domain-containing protein [Rectinemataceae bacterium]
MKNFTTLASRDSIDRAIKALGENGIQAEHVQSKADAARRVLELVPKGAEVFTAGSVTLDELGLAKELNESGNYDGVKSRLMKMDQKTQGREMRKLGAGPDFALGSAHAVTETGSVLFASLTGSQLPAYAYGAGTVIWVVSAKKIVKDVEEGFKRIWEHVLPLESVRARKAYGLPDSFNSYPGKVLVFNREIQPGRVRMIIVNEDIGF